MAICLIIPRSFFISSKLFFVSLLIALMISSFAVYLFNRRTDGISRDFAGKNSSLTQLMTKLSGGQQTVRWSALLGAELFVLNQAMTSTHHLLQLNQQMP